MEKIPPKRRRYAGPRCEQCGAHLTTIQRVPRVRLFCSPRCKAQFNRDRRSLLIDAVLEGPTPYQRKEARLLFGKEIILAKQRRVLREARIQAEEGILEDDE